jgi:hypothetical protein
VHDGPFGRDITTTVAVTAYEPDRRFDLRIPGGPFRLAEPLLKRRFERSFRRYHDQLKRNLETRGPATSTPAR